MINWKDRIAGVEEGTPVNRANLMDMQGFGAKHTIFNADGSITETFTSGTMKTTFNADGSIGKTFIGVSGERISKMTFFESDGSIREVIV